MKDRVKKKKKQKQNSRFNSLTDAIRLVYRKDWQYKAITN